MRPQRIDPEKREAVSQEDLANYNLKRDGYST
jgi:hypothetical protein